MLYKHYSLILLLSLIGTLVFAQSPNCFLLNKKNNASVLILYPNQTYAYFVQKPNGFKKDSGNYVLSKKRNALKLKSLDPVGFVHDLTDVDCYWQNQSIINDMGAVLFNAISHQDSALRNIRSNVPKRKSNTGVQPQPNQAVMHTQYYSVKVLDAKDSWYTKIRQFSPEYVKTANQFADSLYKQDLDNRKAYYNYNPGNSKIYQLAKSLTQNFQSDSLKVMALSNWMVRNFHYDLNGPIVPEKVLEAKATRCQGYADFMSELCLGINLPCLTINGYADNLLGNRVFDQATTNHAWNIVKIKGQWRLIDVTWMDPVGGVNNAVNGQSDYFLSQPHDFLYDHMPSQTVFKFTNLREQSINEYVNSPIRFQKTSSLQYLGPLQTIQFVKDSSIIFYVYSKKASQLKCEFNDSDAWGNPIDIPLGIGVNKVSLKVPSRCRQLYFSNDALSFRFKTYSENNQQPLFEEAIKEDESPYTKQFYGFIQQQLKGKQLAIDPSLDQSLKDPTVWLNVLKTYTGRLPATTLYSYSETNLNAKGKSGSKQVLEYRFFMTGLTINGQDVFVKSKVNCPFDQYMKSSQSQCPLSQMVLSLKDPKAW